MPGLLHMGPPGRVAVGRSNGRDGKLGAAVRLRGRVLGQEAPGESIGASRTLCEDDRGTGDEPYRATE